MLGCECLEESLPRRCPAGRGRRPARSPTLCMQRGRRRVAWKHNTVTGSAINRACGAWSSRRSWPSALRLRLLLDLYPTAVSSFGRSHRGDVTSSYFEGSVGAEVGPAGAPSTSTVQRRLDRRSTVRQRVAEVGWSGCRWAGHILRQAFTGGSRGFPRVRRRPHRGRVGCRPARGTRQRQPARQPSPTLPSTRARARSPPTPVPVTGRATFATRHLWSPGKPAERYAAVDWPTTSSARAPSYVAADRNIAAPTCPRHTSGDSFPHPSLAVMPWPPLLTLRPSVLRPPPCPRTAQVTRPGG